MTDLQQRPMAPGAIEKIFENKIVAILRGCKPENILDITAALYEGGIRLLEVTLNSPEAIDAIKRVNAQFGNRLLVGAGTVLTPAEVEAAVDAGARFIISPSFESDVIRRTRALGAVSIPGAFTATEILAAHRGGADIIKVFPASVGAAYFRDLRGPFPHIPLMPTGGLHLDNIREFQKAGAVAFGVGSSLVPASQSWSPDGLLQLRTRAASFVAAVAKL